MFIKIYLVFPRLPFGIVAYAFTLFWTTFVETAVYSRIERQCPGSNITLLLSLRRDWMLGTVHLSYIPCVHIP